MIKVTGHSADGGAAQVFVDVGDVAEAQRFMAAYPDSVEWQTMPGVRLDLDLSKYEWEYEPVVQDVR